MHKSRKAIDEQQKALTKRKLKITPEDWVQHPYAKGNVISKNSKRLIASCVGYSTNTDNGEHIEENLANAALVCEAGTVANETGLTPVELNAQRIDLLECLMDAQEMLIKVYAGAMIMNRADARKIFNGSSKGARFEVAIKKATE